MQLRTGRALTVAALAAASVTVVSTTAASAAPAKPSPLVHTTSTSRATSTHMAAQYGGYPLHVSTLTDKVLAPLQLSVSKRYGVLVGDAGTSRLKQIRKGGALRTLVQGPQPGEISGVNVNRYGDVAYTFSDYTTSTTGITILRKGHKPVTADLSAFEKKYNPDKVNHYGTTSTDTCVTDFLKATGAPVTSTGSLRYTGLVDSHPYSVAAVHGGWVVGEAAGNDLLFVDNRGHVKLLAVLPPQPHVFTAAEAAALQAPSCLVDVRYDFEPVPTDVEVGPHGALYVSTLPGGPEVPGLARGSVYRLSANGHHLRRLATGFNGATNLAVTSSGRVLVAELFGGRISTIEHGRPARVLDVPGVASLEFFCHALYAGVPGPTDDQGTPPGNGKVIKISVRWCRPRDPCTQICRSAPGGVRLPGPPPAASRTEHRRPNDA